MSPPWAGRVVLDGFNSIIYVQLAAAVGAPVAADGLGFITSAEFSQEASVTEKGPYVNLSTVKKTIASYSASGSMTVDVAAGVDAVRAMFFTAIGGLSRLKFTFQIGGATGDKHVFDQCVIGMSGSIDPGEGTTYDLTFDADSYVFTAASA